MGKKVRRNSKSRNTKSRNNLRRSKVRRNKSTKKARKQRRGSRKQRGGDRELSLQLGLSQIRHEEKQSINNGVQYYRVWVNLPGFERKGEHVTSKYHTTEKGNIITVIN
jgi:hypothetical protein